MGRRKDGMPKVTPVLFSRENSPGVSEWLDTLEKNPDILGEQDEPAGTD